nr:copper chaperone PCu(A)C [Rhizobium cremeum]
MTCVTASFGPASSHDFTVGSLEIKHPWSLKAPVVAPVLGGYLTIVNTGTTDDRLLGGSSPVAERFEIHVSSVVDGVARMRPVKEGITISAGSTVKLEPGAAHIMFEKPTQRPAEGEKFKATLQFQKAGAVEVEFVVQKGATANSDDHAGHTP